MKSIAFFNNKGGVSKTTTVLNIAYILGEVYGRKVLVVDCDGQQNASRFLADELTEVGVEKTLITAAVSPREALSTTRYEHIDVLTSTTDMNRCAEQFQSLSKAEKEKNLSKLSGFWSDQYDYVLLDLPPARNSLTEQLIGITDGVIVPVELGSFAIQGIAKVTETINRVGAAFIGCFISKYDKKNKADEELKKLLENNLGNKVFSTVIKAVQTVAKVISTLATKGLVMPIKRSVKANGYKGTYIYEIKKLPTNDSFYFVDRSIFGKLVPRQLMIYLFISKSFSMELKDCWNSYNDIAAQTGMKRETIIETITELESLKLIRRSKRKSRENKRVYVDNHYFLIVYITGKIRKHCKKIARMYCEYNRTGKLLYKSILLNCNSNTKKSICQVGSKNFFESG